MTKEITSEKSAAWDRIRYVLARHEKLSKKELVVLLTHCVCANTDGEHFWSTRKAAKIANMKPWTFRRVTKRLEERKILNSEKRGKGGRSDIHRLRFG